MKAVKMVKENLDGDQGDVDRGPFVSDDAWNCDALADVGLMDWLDTAAKIGYEVNNCRRGAYGVRGETAQDLVEELEELHSTLADVIEAIKNHLDRKDI